MNRLRWIGGMMCVEKEREPKSVLLGQTEEEIPNERPSKRWEKMWT